MKRAAFLDRDGVINIDHAYVHDREHFEWVPGVLEGARMLTDAGFEVEAVYGDLTFESPKADEQRVIYVARMKTSRNKEFNESKG